MKKLIIISPIFPPDVGGPASYVYELGQKLKHDFIVSILGFCEGKPALMKNVEINMINPKKQCFFVRQFKLWRNLKKYALDADFVYVQGPVVVGFLSLIFAKIYKKKNAMKFVGDLAWEDASRRGKTKEDLEAWLLNPRKDLKSRILRFVEKLSFNNAEKIVVPSIFLRNVLSQFYSVPTGKIEIINNAFDPHSFEKNEPERAYNLMCAGRLVPHKNIHLIVEAISKLPEHYTLDIFGDGPAKNEVLEKINSLNLNSRVRLMGNVSKNKLFDEMRKHDLFILYSSYEGLPHVILEAFAAKCPVVASNIPGTREVAIDDQTSVLAESMNPQRLSEAIRNLSWDRKKRISLSSNALKLLKRDFSWDSHTSKLKSFV